MNQCKVTRRKLVKHGHLTATGLEIEREEWVTEPCGTPLFTPEEGYTGICRSCARGWTHPENYPVKADSFDRDFLQSVGIKPD